MFGAVQGINLKKRTWHVRVDVVGYFYAAIQPSRTRKEVQHVLVLAVVLNPRFSFWRFERIAVKGLPQISKLETQIKKPPRGVSAVESDPARTSKAAGSTALAASGLELEFPLENLKNIKNEGKNYRFFP